MRRVDRPFLTFLTSLDRRAINNCPCLIARRRVSLVSTGPQTTSLTFIHWARKKFRNTNRFMYRQFVLVIGRTLREELPRGTLDGIPFYEIR